MCWVEVKVGQTSSLSTPVRVVPGLLIVIPYGGFNHLRAPRMGPTFGAMLLSGITGRRSGAGETGQMLTGGCVRDIESSTTIHVYDAASAAA